MAEGYVKLAALMGRNDRIAVFRQFTALNTKNLLYMQAELVNLEAELEDIIQEDHDSPDPGKSLYHTSWTALKEPLGNGRSSIQLLKVLEIREKLNIYNAALLQYARVRSFHKPESADIAFLREWLKRPHGGDFFLKGRESDPWEPRRANDLILPSKRHTRKDCLAQWISDATVPWFHRYFGQGMKMKKPLSEDEWSEIWDYDDEIFVAIGNGICTALSSLLPSASILVLYYLGNPITRLFASMGFTVLFSLVLALVVRARRAEVFAATTAFAAVQVVFVGGTNFCGTKAGYQVQNQSMA